MVMVNLIARTSHGIGQCAINLLYLIKILLFATFCPKYAYSFTLVSSQSC